ALALYGETGLLPIKKFISATQTETVWLAFLDNPTLFHFVNSDAALLAVAWLGAALALVVLLGYANSIIMFSLWLLYMSYVNAGQLFYGFGWEIQTLELGFLMIFLTPLFDGRPFPNRAPPLPVIWLLRFFLFRFYLGAGLIKLRGSECWDDFTCLFYHFETQPIPNPISPFMHFLPDFVLKFGVMFAEFLQVICAFFVFYPRFLRVFAGLIFLTFQSTLILTGNYSFFNWVTLIPALVLFDDRFLAHVLPKKLVTKAERAEMNKRQPLQLQNNFIYAVFGILVWLSLPVLGNLVSDKQIMNTSFNRWALVNTYGAFGYVGKQRFELVISGTGDRALNADTQWQEYEFVAKPTNIKAGLPIIAPYQPRIDWQIWFAAQSDSSKHGWLIHLLWKFLHNDPHSLGLIGHNPFPDEPPAFIKVDRYLYQFEPPLAENTWKRTYIDTWMQPLSRDNASLRNFIRQNQWHEYE
ncbi:MAG: lipase maturation factor family protein, partial [Arenicella sp.]|nr:lipase maturation factor family protein [Arenicella sp.]